MAEAVGSDYQGFPGDDEISLTARLHRLERQFSQVQRLAQFGTWVPM